jgi:hypothetical protein
MSNQYYVQFCAVISKLTKKEKRWLEEALGPIDQAPSWPIIAKLKAQGVDPSEWPNFEYRFYHDQGGCLEVFSEEYGDTHGVGVLFQMFLKTFRPHHYLTLNWSCHCYQLEAGQDGGGAVFVTAHSIKNINTGVWLDEQARRWRKKHEDHDAQQPRPRRPHRRSAKERQRHRQTRQRKT